MLRPPSLHELDGIVRYSDLIEGTDSEPDIPFLSCSRFDHSNLGLNVTMGEPSPLRYERPTFGFVRAAFHPETGIQHQFLTLLGPNRISIQASMRRSRYLSASRTNGDNISGWLEFGRIREPTENYD